MVSRQELLKFTADELQQYLDQKLDLCTQTLESFATNRIDGDSFVELRETELRELVAPLGDRKKIQKLLSRINRNIRHRVYTYYTRTNVALKYLYSLNLTSSLSPSLIPSPSLSPSLRRSVSPSLTPSLRPSLTALPLTPAWTLLD